MFDFLFGGVTDFIINIVITVVLVLITIFAVVFLPAKTKIWGLILMVLLILFVWFRENIMTFINTLVGMI